LPPRLTFSFADKLAEAFMNLNMWWGAGSLVMILLYSLYFIFQIVKRNRRYLLQAVKKRRQTDGREN